MKNRIAGAWEKLVAVQARGEEELRLGRLFNTLMVISLGIVVALSIVFLLMQPLGLLDAKVSWIAAAFPLGFIPLSLFCLMRARRGHIRAMVLLYVWVNLIAIGVAAWLFDGIRSPGWPLFIWTITVAGTLLAPAYSLRMTGGVVVYYLLLLATECGFYVPPLTFGAAGRDFVQMSFLLIMLVSSVGLLTFLNMRSLNDALEKLRQGEQRFRSIFEHVGDIIYTVEADGTFSSISPSCERMLGWRTQEWVGRQFSPIVHPEDLPYMQELFVRAQEGKTLPVFQVRILMKMGGYLEAEVAATPIRRDGKIVTLGVVRDITERKRAAQAIEESERKFRTILDVAVDGVLLADVETRKFINVNSAICDMLGYGAEELRQLAVEDIHPAQALPEVLQQFERLMRGDIHVASNLPVRRKDGSVFLADISAAPMPLAGRTVLVGIFHDVTERKRAEDEIRTLNEALESKVQQRTQQLLEAQEELVRKEKLAVLGQVAGSVGHELRNPLGVMSNAVYFLQTVLADADETTRDYLNIIKGEIASSERIVSDLLDSVRTKPPQPETVGIAELIAQTLGKLAVPPEVKVILDIPEPLAPLWVDAMQIHQVLRNLISNGIEAMPEGGTLQIGARENRPDKTVTISVRDSGVGMTAEQLNRLFQPLFTTKARGIGLGLMVVKNLTRANGGTVKVESEAGKGTLFAVTLPAA
ncbi:MAG: PAS domain S-box protein [Sideroxydans sp.]|nr:PAS domain S-box protein [Sideroxydans sp.]